MTPNWPRDTRPTAAPTRGDTNGLRVAGIPVRVDWTAAVLFALLTFALATGLLPAAASGLATGAYWVAGAAAAGLLLASLLGHELAHALVARRHGTPVEGINLWLFGGVARMHTDAPKPRTELRIAAVGPIASLAAGGAFAALAAGANALPVAGPPLTLAVTVLGYLAMANGLLAAFNLLPGLPLDGGRILRALLWRRHGDQVRATVSAARAGQVLGMLMIGAGVAQLVMSSIIGGIWLAVIGWFIMTAATTEARVTATRTALGGLRVRDAMRPDPLIEPSWHSVGAVLARYAAEPPGPDSWQEGMITLRAFDGGPAGLVPLAALTAVPADDRETTRLSALALPAGAVPQAHPDELLTEVLGRPHGLSRTAAGHALVVEDGAVVGMVSPMSVSRAAQLARFRRDAGGGAEPFGGTGPSGDSRDDRVPSLPRL